MLTGHVPQGIRATAGNPRRGGKMRKHSIVPSGRFGSTIEELSIFPAIFKLLKTFNISRSSILTLKQQDYIELRYI